jgi:hypothetical protein
VSARIRERPSSSDTRYERRRQWQYSVGLDGTHGVSPVQTRIGTPTTTFGGAIAAAKPKPLTIPGCSMPSSSVDSVWQSLSEAGGRFRWAIKTARHAEPKSFAARLRLLWHDFVLHTLLNSGRQPCQDCGHDYPLWRASDEDWNLVQGGPWGILCERCFTALLRAKQNR